jgi:hypothetical protein
MWATSAGLRGIPEPIVFKSLKQPVLVIPLLNNSSLANEEVKKLGLDPAKTTTVEWLGIDDRGSRAQQAA